MSDQERTKFGRSLTNKQAIEVKNRLWEGEAPESVAKDMGVATMTIYRVRDGKTYKKVPWPDGTKGRMGKKNLTKAKMIVQHDKFMAMHKAFIPGEKTVQVDPKVLAKIEQEDELSVRNAIKIGQVKKREIVKQEYPRFGLDVAIEAYPDMKIIKTVSAHSSNELKYVTEVVLHYAREKAVVPGLYDFKAFCNAIRSAADKMNMLDKLPDLNELLYD